MKLSIIPGSSLDYIDKVVISVCTEANIMRVFRLSIFLLPRSAGKPVGTKVSVIYPAISYLTYGQNSSLLLRVHS
jgi:hypothetical protein